MSRNPRGQPDQTAATRKLPGSSCCDRFIRRPPAGAAQWTSFGVPCSPVRRAASRGSRQPGTARAPGRTARGQGGRPYRPCSDDTEPSHTPLDSARSEKPTRRVSFFFVMLLHTALLKRPQHCSAMPCRLFPYPADRPGGPSAGLRAVTTPCHHHSSFRQGAGPREARRGMTAREVLRDIVVGVNLTRVRGGLPQQEAGPGLGAALTAGGLTLFGGCTPLQSCS